MGAARARGPCVVRVLAANDAPVASGRGAEMRPPSSAAECG